jgi:hypothetical protein
MQWGTKVPGEFKANWAPVPIASRPGLPRLSVQSGRRRAEAKAERQFRQWPSNRGDHRGLAFITTIARLL